MLDFMASWFTPTTLFCVLNLMIGIIFITSNLKSHHHKPPPSPSPSPSPDEEYHHHHHPLLRAPSILERVRSFNFSLYSSEQQPDNDPLHFSPFHLDPHQQPNYHPPQLVRAPSLERVRSFNLSLYRSEQPDPDPLQFSTHHLDPQQADDEDEDEDEHNNNNNNPPQLVRAPSLLERVKSFNFSLYRSEQPDPVQHETHHVEEAHVTRRGKSDKTGEGPRPGPAKMKKSASQKARAAAAEEEKVDRWRPATMRERNAAAAYGEEEEEVDAKADDFINRFKQQLKLQRLDSILRYRDMLNRGAGR